ASRQYARHLLQPRADESLYSYAPATTQVVKLPSQVPDPLSPHARQWCCCKSGRSPANQSVRQSDGQESWRNHIRYEYCCTRQCCWHFSAIIAHAEHTQIHLCL